MSPLDITAEEIVERVLFPIIVALFTMMIPLAVNQLKINKREKEAKKRETLIRNKIDIYTMQHILQDDYNHYMKQGHVSMEQLQNWQKKFMTYIEIGGNSIMIEMNDEVTSLPKDKNQD